MDTSINNPTHAIAFLNKGQDIALVGNKLEQCNLLNSLTLRFRPAAHAEEIKKVIEFIFKQLKNCNSLSTQKNTYLNLSQSLIKLHQGASGQVGKIIKQFDRLLVSTFANDPHVALERIEYNHTENQKAFKKWTDSYGLPPEIFQKYPDFVEFLESSRLLSQLKITRDTLKEQEGEPCLIVEGNWMPFSQIKEKFIVIKEEGEIFVKDRNTMKVFTYLDNGNGLQIHHPYFSELTPISKINDSEYQILLNKAQLFVREGEEGLPQSEQERLQSERTFILQIVSSFMEGPEINASKLLLQSNHQHPYIRVIPGVDNPELGTQKGGVYEVGFMLKKKPMLPFMSTQGRFRSPDLREYIPCKERVVTNIAITQGEARKLMDYTLKYHREGHTGFHYAKQNCSVYVRSAIASIGINVPTEIHLVDLIHDITPDWIKKIANAIESAKKAALCQLKKITLFIHPKIREEIATIVNRVINIVKRFFEIIAALSLVPSRFFLGETTGKGGVAFDRPDQKESRIRGYLLDIKNYFDFSSYKFNLPGVLQEWQRRQASTEIYTSTIKLSIVPQSDKNS